MNLLETNLLQFTGPSPNITDLSLAVRNIELLLHWDENTSQFSLPYDSHLQEPNLTHPSWEKEKMGRRNE